jgi:NADH:ubiquinone oxidoreductase subunit C
MHTFQMNYLFCNWRNNQRLGIRIGLSTNYLFNLYRNINEILSCCKLFEREIWDLFWYYIFKTPRLYEEFSQTMDLYGHRLRKDFPVCGYFVIKI